MIKFKPPWTSFVRNYTRKTYDLKCEDGSISTYTSINEQYIVFYKCAQEGIDFHAKLSAKFAGRIKFKDVLEVIMTNQKDKKSTRLNLITSSKRIREAFEKKGYDPNYERLSDLDTLDEVFIDVFKRTNPSRRITEFYYSMDLGIVAFNDTLSGFGFTMEWNRLIAVKTVCSFAVIF